MSASMIGPIVEENSCAGEQAMTNWLRDLDHDVRYACRTLRSSPGFALVAVLTLALGIGATTAISSIVDTILLQPLPFADSDRLVRVVENVPSPVAGRAPVQRGLNYRAFLEWRAHSQALSDSIWFTSNERIVRTRDGMMRLWGGDTSVNAFALLGARAMLGRTLNGRDAGDPNVIVLGFDAWRRLFNSDRGVVGTTVEVHSSDPLRPGARVLTIVGVMPAGFEFPAAAMDFYIPFVLDDATRRYGGTMIGRLAPGVSLKSAEDEANAIGAAIPALRPTTPLRVPRFEVQSLKDQIVRGLRPALRVLLAAVAVVLLIVCANVANLCLVRGAARQREMAVRLAIGASGGRIVRQVLTESFVLALAGGALGALFASAGLTLVKTLAAVDAPGIFRRVFGASLLPRANELGVDVKMFGIAFAIAAMTSVVFGLLPALHLSRAAPLSQLGSRSGGGDRRVSRIRSTLVVGQLVMATVLLVGAGLLIRSFARLSAVDNGYDPSNVLAFQLVMPAEYPLARKVATTEAILARLRKVPGVEAAGFTRAGVLIPEEIYLGTFVPPGRTVDDMRVDPLRPHLRSVSAGYLTAMGVPTLDGREFTQSDAATSAPVVVISRTVARRYFAAANAVGQFVDWHVGKGVPIPMQVVGVVEDVRNESPDREAYPDIFVEYQQLLKLSQEWGESTERRDLMALGLLSFALRTRGNPATVAPAIGQIVRSVDPGAGTDGMIPMDRLVSSAVARPRFYAVMLGVFAGVAGLLAAIGIYGVLACAVAQRTQEIGIRMALGAQPAQVLALVLRRGLILAGVGIAVGLAGAAAGTRLLRGMLFGITPLDPGTFVVVALLFGLVAAMASYLPARRATMVDPMVALRSE